MERLEAPLDLVAGVLEAVQLRAWHVWVADRCMSLVVADQLAVQSYTLVRLNERFSPRVIRMAATLPFETRGIDCYSLHVANPVAVEEFSISSNHGYLTWGIQPPRFPVVRSYARAHSGWSNRVRSRSAGPSAFQQLPWSLPTISRVLLEKSPASAVRLQGLLAFGSSNPAAPTTDCIRHDAARLLLLHRLLHQGRQMRNLHLQTCKLRIAALLHRRADLFSARSSALFVSSRAHPNVASLEGQKTTLECLQPTPLIYRVRLFW
ncbi:unnamed protein product [Ectocarpus sp. CCAP 1310/34]|nr:unnamed protein product [Ectocarpus sp. CCAP 1310/34]